MTPIIFWALLTQVVSTAFLTGIAWFLQIVHYPLFAGISEDDFPQYESRHMSRTTALMGPAMLIEATSAVFLFYSLSLFIGSGKFLAANILLVVIWIITTGVQSKIHRRLATGFDGILIKRLVATNWIRTFAWTVRLYCVVCVFVEILPSLRPLE
jgi:hypothetical protein